MASLTARLLSKFAFKSKAFTPSIAATLYLLYTSPVTGSVPAECWSPDVFAAIVPFKLFKANVETPFRFAIVTSFEYTSNLVPVNVILNVPVKSFSNPVDLPYNFILELLTSILPAPSE